MNVRKIALFVFFGLLAACSTKPPQSDISSSANPQVEIRNMSDSLAAAREANIDVLARSDYQKAEKSWEKAKTDSAAGRPQESILDDVRWSKTNLAKAYSTAENRSEKGPGLFAARKEAMRAGATRQPGTRNEMESLDKDVANVAEDLNELSPQKIAVLQERYLSLEKKATIETHLGESRARINGARNSGAAKQTPNVLKKAELSLQNAESLISSNVRSPEVFAKSVSEAKFNAELLTDVTETIKNNGKGLSESAALRMVSQKRQISDLKKDLTVSAEDKAQTEAELQAKNRALSYGQQAMDEKDQALKSAQSVIDVQKAVAQSQSHFSPEEAEAYQQGSNLLIRLKAVKFSSGRSDLPAQSLPLLAKVADLAKSLNAKEINVQGHTDSSGSIQINKTLSQERAAAVASYFKSNGFGEIPVGSEGFGYEKPIAPNKTAAGRAQNRRVDVIITPGDRNISLQ